MRCGTRRPSGQVSRLIKITKTDIEVLQIKLWSKMGCVKNILIIIFRYMKIK